jgi:diamine N-acetyltransferase
MEIRPATLDDYDALTALEAEVQAIHVEAMPHIYVPGGVYSRASYAELFAAPNNVIVLAIEAGQAVGYMHYEVKTREASEFTFASKSLHIHALSVKETERRKGYGEALMDYALARAAEHKVDRVTLDVGAFNQAATAFYERLGFAPAQVRMAYEL